MSYAESWISLSPEAFDFTQLDIPFLQQPNVVKDPNPWTEEEDRLLREVVGHSGTFLRPQQYRLPSWC